MIASHGATPRATITPGLVAGLLVLIGLLVSTGLFMIGAYSAMVYVVIVFCSVVAFAAPTRWGIASLVFFAGMAGMLKDIANYETVAHLGNDFVLVSLLVGHLARAASRQEPVIGDMPFRRPLAVLLIAATVFMFLPLTNPIVALAGWKGYVLPAMLVPVIYLGLREPGSARPVIGAIIITGIGNAAAAIFEQAQGPQVVASWGPGFVRNIAFYTFAFDASGHMTWRPFGLAQDAGSAAIIEAVAASIMVYLAFGKRSFTQLMSIMGAALCIIAAYNSGVRTAVLMIAFGVLGAILVQVRVRISSILPRLVAAVIVLSVVAVAIQGSSSAVQGRVGGLLSADTYISSRGAIYALLGSALLTQPVGLGMGRAVPGGGILTSFAGVAQGDAVTNENTFLVMVFELGWIGFGFLVAIIWQLAGVVRLYIAKVVVDREGGLAAVLLMVLLVSALASPLIASQPGNLYLWLFATLAVVRARDADVPDEELAASPQA